MRPAHPTGSGWQRGPSMHPICQLALTYTHLHTPRDRPAGSGWQRGPSMRPICQLALACTYLRMRLAHPAGYDSRHSQWREIQLRTGQLPKSQHTTVRAKLEALGSPLEDKNT